MRMLNGHVAVTWPGLDLVGHQGADAHEREVVPGSEAGLVYGRSVTTPSALVWHDDYALGLWAGERVIAVRVEAEMHRDDGIEVQMICTQRVEHVTRKGERVRLRTQLHPIAAVWREGQWRAVGQRLVGMVEAPPPASSLLHVEPQPEPYRRLRVASVGAEVWDLSPGMVVLVPADAVSRMEWRDASGEYLSVQVDDVHAVAG